MVPSGQSDVFCVFPLHSDSLRLVSLWIGTDWLLDTSPFLHISSPAPNMLLASYDL